MKTQVVLTDKDCREINAVQEVFPHAVHLLCNFHTLAAVDRRLGDANLSRDLRHEIYECFRKAVYANSEEKIKEAEDYLCSLGITKYF